MLQTERDSAPLDTVKIVTPGLDNKNRTCDLLLPKQAFYQTELYLDMVAL